MVNRALRWLGKARRDRITLIAARSSGGSTRGVVLSALGFWAIVVLIALVAGVTCVSYIVMSSSVISSSRLHDAKDAKIRELVAENQELNAITGAQQDRLAFMSEQLQMMESKIRTISDLGEEIIAALGSEVELSSRLDLLSLGLPSQYHLLICEPFLGSGGVDREPAGYMVADSPSVFRVSDLAKVKLEVMMGKLTQDLEAFTSLKSEAAAYAHRINHTPTIWPATGPISSLYGGRVHPIYGVPRFHDGIDIAVYTGTPVKAAADGLVTWSGDRDGYGLTVIIDHGYGTETLYAHNSRLAVRQGNEVKKGQVISYSGSTGVSSGPHLHYEVRVAGKSVDPMIYLD